MVRTALVLESDTGLQVLALPAAGATLGRGADADLRLIGDTVSRLHAAIRPDSEGRPDTAGLGSASPNASGCIIETLSQTNPTHVNDVAIDRPVPLADGDRLRLGSARLTFHDLASGDRISGPLCSHCARENRPDDHDCWFCGTSLINAPTNVLAHREVSCRLVSEAGDASTAGAVHDLLPGESFAINADGAGAVQREGESLPGAKTLVRLSGSQAVLADPLPPGLRLNDVAARPGQRLSSGDALRSGDTTFVIIARVDS